ncbi:MAG: DUF1178 family protein [Betaproteobacteria bacterium]
MKVYNLSCSMNHLFEGWFSSEDDFNAQQNKSILSCPICDSVKISRLPSAPYLGAKTSTKVDESIQQASNSLANIPAGVHQIDSMSLSPAEKMEFQQKLQATMLQVVRDVMEKTEDVGESFVDEARKMHYHEAPERSIRGVASHEQASELIEEGIDIFALPAVSVLKNTLQ